MLSSVSFVLLQVPVLHYWFLCSVQDIFIILPQIHISNTSSNLIISFFRRVHVSLPYNTVLHTNSYTMLCIVAHLCLTFVNGCCYDDFTGNLVDMLSLMIFICILATSNVEVQFSTPLHTETPGRPSCYSTNDADVTPPYYVIDDQ